MLADSWDIQEAEQKRLNGLAQGFRDQEMTKMTSKFLAFVADGCYYHLLI